jgi:TetR/AcrR family transcriptional repressor of nem operon
VSPARAFRAAGLAGVGIAELMSRAGLTHGGFYAHFKSRDALVAAACERAIEETSSALFRDVAELPREAQRAAVVGRYLSRTHRDHAAEGCALAAVGSEVPHQGAGVRRAFGRATRALLDKLATLARDRDDALVMASTMVGALMLARAVDDRALSDQILRTAKRALTRDDAAG